MKAFEHARVPKDLSKIDRLTSAIAHLWWRTHDVDWTEGLPNNDVEDLDWTVYSEDAVRDQERPKMEGEAIGRRLRSAARSLEGLRRLMFSTLMLCWNLHLPTSIFVGGVAPRRLSFAGWSDMNKGIEADAGNFPLSMQKGIYQTVLDGAGVSRLLPAETGLPATPHACPKAVGSAMEMRDHSMRVEAWASIPRGGLLRNETTVGAAVPTAKLSNCVLSEAGSSHALATFMTSPELPASADGEPVFLSLRLSLFLFLYSSQVDAVPYAFLRLQDAQLSNVDGRSRTLTLTGRQRESVKAPGSGSRLQHPLPLCFLLADGRFQPFEALCLELLFSNEEEAELWARELGVACERCEPSSVSAGGNWRPPGEMGTLDGGASPEAPPFGKPLSGRCKTMRPDPMDDILDRLASQGAPRPAG